MNNYSDVTMNSVFRFSKDRGLKLCAQALKAKNCFLNKIETNEYRETECNCICGAQKNDILLATVDRYGFHVNTFICKQCGLIRINPYLDEGSLQKFYNTDYDNIYRIETPANIFFQDQLNQGNAILKMISSVKDDVTNLTVMEIGCSMGGNLLPFQQIGCSVFGVDYNQDHIAKGKKLGMDLRVGSWENLQDAAPSDILILSHVLEHMTNPVLFLKNVLKLVNENGLIYVAVPAIEDIPSSYGYDIMSWLQNAHAYNFSNLTLKEVIRLSGAEPIWDNGRGVVIARKSKESGSCCFDVNEAHSIKMKKYEQKFQLFHNVPTIFRHNAAWYLKMFLPYGIVRYFQLTKGG